MRACVTLVPVLGVQVWTVMSLPAPVFKRTKWPERESAAEPQNSNGRVVLLSMQLPGEQCQWERPGGVGGAGDVGVTVLIPWANTTCHGPG